MALFALLLWVELPGSWLTEPDEARYAEIPREMIASGDVITPRLNGAPYLEKPPLLYWLNGAAIRVLGPTPFAARLASRLAAMATAVMLIAALDADLAGWGWFAALIVLSCPLGFAFGRYNATDGLLTAALTLALLALRRVLAAPDGKRPGVAVTATLGGGMALAVLAKGLPGVVFPMMVALGWCAVMRRWRQLAQIILSPAPVVFLAVAAPWFALVERANPGFARFFFLHEHLERFATTEAHRTGSFLFPTLILLAGLLPWTPFVVQSAVSSAGRRLAKLRSDGDALFFILWMVSVLVVFSLSQSKLISYVLPAVPAAAALAARSLVRGDIALGKAVIGLAILASITIAGGIAFGVTSGEFSRYSVTNLALFAGASVLTGVWASVWRVRQSKPPLAPLSLGIAGLYLALVLALPKVSDDLTGHDVAVAAGRVPDATVVSYRTFLYTLPWHLGHPVAAAGHVGEIGSLGGRPPQLDWTREELWRRWNSGERLVVVLQRRRATEFRDSVTVAARAVASDRRYLVFANFDSTPLSAP
ncbi:MAG TPA: phospholipid carrier-dependent glycosyltransferase [Gemmatimonadaceae bacterium]|nr:phospholipid carrier-dependent glycosyltransferase [Gemmatimonadaceae bacterium]